MIDRASSTVKSHQAADNDEAEEVAEKTIPESLISQRSS